MADGEMLQDRAKFHAMTEGTAEDWAAIGRASAPHRGELADRLLAHLKLLDNDHGGFAVDRLEHSLQTATRAHRDGRDEEYVVCALIHDIGDTLASFNHAEFAATMLKPFISEKNHWIVANHGVYQGYYWFHYLGTDRNKREALRGHEWWPDLEEFCRKYDCAAFNPDYQSMKLEEFEPMVRRVFSAPKQSLYAKPVP
jgi:predicted HD phosphohydrolase